MVFSLLQFFLFAVATDAGVPSSARLRGAEIPRELEDSKPPTIWATSGGGWRAMAGAFGFARAFSKVPSFLQDLAAISCNSGGCWFLSMFAYDKQTYDFVTGDREIYSWYLDMMETQVAAVNHTTNGWVEHKLELAEATAEATTASATTTRSSDLHDLCSKLAEIFSKRIGGDSWGEIFTVCAAGQRHDYNWRSTVQDLLNFGVNNRTDMGTAPADQTGRALKGPALVFQTANATSAYIYDEHRHHISTFSLDNDGRYSFDVSQMPLQWIVPSEDEFSKGTKAQWSVPTWGKAYSVGACKDSSCLDLDAVIPGKLERVQAMKPPFDGSPTLRDVVSASSAAAGMLGSPLMMSDSFDFKVPHDWSPLKKAGAKILALEGIQNSGLQAFAVCDEALEKRKNQKGEYHYYCPYGSTRFVDGGFVDNIATAQTVGYLQRRFPGKPLRMVLTDASRKTDNNGTVDDRSDIWLLMDRSTDSKTLCDERNCTLKPGQTLISAQTGGIKRPQPQVFDCVFEKLTWHKVTKFAPGYPKDPHNLDLQWTTCSATTVQNDKFSVLAGTKVELLIFVMGGNSTLGTFNFGVNNQYADAAATIAASNADDILKNWLKKTESV